MNAGAILLGIIDGLLIGLLAVGLVLVYRSSRFLNLAHAQLGAVPAVFLAKLVLEWGVPYLIALPACVAIGVGTGIVIERVFIARLRRKSKSAVAALLLTVGITQLLLFFTAIDAFKPDLFVLSEEGYPILWDTEFTFDGVIFGGHYVMIAVLCPILVFGVGAFLQRSVYGKMIRAAASNEDAARLCGISPRMTSAITWGIAGGLSTISAVLVAPSSASQAVTGGVSLGAGQLLVAIGAAAFGAFVSIPQAMLGGVAIGVVNRVALYETSNGGTARLMVFVLILGVIFARGRAIGAVFASEGASVDDLAPMKVPQRVRERLVGRRPHGILVAGGLLIAVLAPLLPALDGNDERFRLGLVIFYAVVGISLTMLIGWAGQLSLGHIGVVGMAAYITGRLSDDGYSLVTIMVLASLLGAVVLVAVGLPALRIRGLTLAVTTLGLAVVASEWLFRSEWFTGDVAGLTTVEPISVLNGIENDGSMLTAYWICLGTLIVVALLARSIRRSTPGRVMIAVRDDEQASAAYGVSPTTVKLSALAVSGSIAGVAGVLFGVLQQSVSPGQFGADLSLAVLAIPVVGGIGSIAGAIAAAVFLYYPTFFLVGFLGDLLGDRAEFLFALAFSGFSTLIVLLFYPTGIAGLAQNLWQRFLKKVDEQLGEAAREPQEGDPVLVADGIRLSFGGIRALNGASIEVRPGEIVGLIGPNGAGKSTLVNVVSGVLAPEEGTVLLNGQDVTTLPPEVRAGLGMGRSFQAANLFPGLTVRETIQAMIGVRARVGLMSSAVRAPWAVGAEKQLAREAQALIDRMGLAEYADTLTSELSTGSRRIVDLTVQIAGKPDVLLLDEPTDGVAQRETEQFGPLLRRIRDELDCAIVIVEHDMPLLMGLCDRIYAMVLGQVIAEGTPEEVRNAPAVVASYLGTDETAIERSGTRREPRPSSARRHERRRRRPLVAAPPDEAKDDDRAPVGTGADS